MVVVEQQRIRPDISLAHQFFAELAARTGGDGGICRDSYGPGEQIAHEVAACIASGLGVTVTRDAALNLYMTLPGRDRTLPALLIGSHLDSVPRGGNYDGAAGVAAGLAVLAGLRQAEIQPACDVTVMAIRAEEAAWFDAPYIGSRAALGELTVAELEGVRRSDDGSLLADRIKACGGDPAALRRSIAHLDPAGLRGFLEVHIEQGPVLEAAGVPIGIVSGIRGCRRFRCARCLGAYAHSGAQPRAYRCDAVAATVALIARLEQDWLERETAGQDLTFTVGELYTDPAQHGPSKVSGETRFVLDFRSLSDEVMIAVTEDAQRYALTIGEAYRVTFDLGSPTYSPPALLGRRIQARLAQETQARNIPFLQMASGAGHDSVVFARAGVPTGMLFIRNANGSHSPEESMEIDDFGDAARVLLDFVLSETA